jgi:tetratricopeptide (TPR) repeat protein
MLKRALVVTSLTLFLMIGGMPLPTTNGALMTEAEVAMLNAHSAEAVDDFGKSDDGNKVVRVLSAPFKAVGRLFGFGKKSDNKLHRLSEKDVKKFESAKVSRVVDARSAQAVAPTNNEGASAPSLDLPIGEPLTGQQVNAARTQQQLELGRQLLATDLNGAIAALSLAISIDDSLYDAHNLLGIAYEAKGMRLLALKALERSLRGDHDKPEHLNDYGYLLSKNADYERALKYLKKAVKLAPGDQRFWNNLGMVQAELRKFDDAYKSFSLAVGEFEGHMNVATRAQRLGYEKEAIEHLEKARVIKPNTLDILARLVVLYGRTGQTQQATEARTSLLAIQATAAAQQ